MATSPYKRMKRANTEWIPFTQMRLLEKNKPYRVVGIQETRHDQYGLGQAASLLHPLGRKFRTQLPKKYLAMLSSEELNTIKSDVVAGKFIFLVYREIMEDNSYRMDVIEGDDAWIESFKANLEVPELEDSLQEGGESGNNGPPNENEPGVVQDGIDDKAKTAD